MTKYIDKSAVVAELNRLIAELVEKGEDTMFEQGRISAFEDVKVFINNTLEVKGEDLEKDVDIEKEFDKCCENYIFDDECEVYRAKHFFKLGIKAQKGEDLEKDVDIEKEFDKCCENYIFDDECEVYRAKHFFKLGIKAQKGE